MKNKPISQVNKVAKKKAEPSTQNEKNAKEKAKRRKIMKSRFEVNESQSEFSKLLNYEREVEEAGVDVSSLDNPSSLSPESLQLSFCSKQVRFVRKAVKKRSNDSKIDRSSKEVSRRRRGETTLEVENCFRNEMQRLGYGVVKAKADGNCLYYSMSIIENGTQGRHEEVRTKLYDKFSSILKEYSDRSPSNEEIRKCDDAFFYV